MRLLTYFLKFMQRLENTNKLACFINCKFLMGEQERTKQTLFNLEILQYFQGFYIEIEYIFFF